MKLSVILLAVLLGVTVNYVRGQTTAYYKLRYEVSEEHRSYCVTSGSLQSSTSGSMQTTTGPAGEVEYEMEEIITTTTAKPTPKPKLRRRKGKKGRKRGRPKGLKPIPGRKAGQPPKKGRKPRPTTRRPTTAAPTPAPTTRPPTPAPTTRPPIIRTTRGPTTRPPTQAPPIVAAAATGYAAGGAPPVDVRVVPQRQRTSPAPTTRARGASYLYEQHSCPRMDVATWENEVVIYDNKNCAIIVRMNTDLRRPTVTFQAPYW